MKLFQFFQSYEFLADKADKAFQKIEKEYGAYIACKPHCSDCCHAVFGLFLIEASYIQHHFSQLDIKEKDMALTRCDQADRDLKRMAIRLSKHENDPQMTALALARERIRCPLLDDNDECILYSSRPITCRIYGIPTAIHGKARVCGMAGFKKGEQYPVFDLDSVYRDLFALSKELLEQAGEKDIERASLLISVSKALRTPIQKLTGESPY
ncbi:MAG: YkgJ family cysteine cluster protein [Deltaproteobacteria bacterium]|nr:YkgJ family cysteine cluster protein [Deltaproteobacteria bacterium]